MRIFGRSLPPAGPASDLPDWRQADPAWIEGALQRSQHRAGGGWVVVDASRQVGGTPRRYRLAGEDWVVWRHGDGVFAAPDQCPHLGASLDGACLRGDRIVCPWHGLELGPSGHGAWQTVPAVDDGWLVWARILRAEAPSDEPVLPVRPQRALDAVVRHEAACDAQDVIANRLDPWHGAHYHPYSFGRLRVVEQLEDEITVRVVYRIGPGVGVEVDARFHCPDPRTIVMTIVAGEGEGSVVETHAAPMASGRCAVVELTLATSDHPRYWTVVRPLAPLIRPLIRRAARRLWVDDAAYAERRYQLRREC